MSRKVNYSRSEVNLRYQRRWPKKHVAHQLVYQAIKSGKLVRPDRCERCEVECKPEATHDDYDKPLEVEFLCTPCHADKDRRTPSTI